MLRINFDSRENYKFEINIKQQLMILEQDLVKSKSYLNKIRDELDGNSKGFNDVFYSNILKQLKAKGLKQINSAIERSQDLNSILNEERLAKGGKTFDNVMFYFEYVRNTVEEIRAKIEKLAKDITRKKSILLI